MANNNGFGNFDMAALINSGLDLSMLNSLSTMNQQQQSQQRPPMPMQNQAPPMHNMGGMQGMNMGMMGNGGGMPQNMGGNGNGNMQQPNNGMNNAQLLEAYSRLQATQSTQQMQNRSGTPNMGSNMPRMPSGQFPNGQGQAPPQQQQQQQPQGDASNHYHQLQRLLASKNTAGALQNPMRPPFNQSQSNDMMQDGRNPAQNGMNPQLAATQAQLRLAASTNLTRVQQMQQSMQQQIQQNLAQQSNPQGSNPGANQGNMFNNFPGQNNSNQFNTGNNMPSGQNPGPSPQMPNAQQQQIRPPGGVPQGSPHGPGRPAQGGAVPQNLLQLNQQFQQLNEQQRQQLMSLYQHQGRAQNAFSNQMTPRTLSQSLQSAGNLNTSPMSAAGQAGQNPGQPPNLNMQAAQGQAMAAAQQRAHLAQQAQQVANQFGNNAMGNQQSIPPPNGGNGQGPKPGQAGNNAGPGPSNPNVPPQRTFDWEKISDAELIETGKGMLPKLAAQIKALQSTPQNSPRRLSMENQIRNNNQIRVTFVKEMRRRNLDMSLVGGVPAGVAQQMQQQAKLATPQSQSQSLAGLNLGPMGMPNNGDAMQVDPQAQQALNAGPGGFQNTVGPRPPPNPATDSGFAANGLPKATTPQGRAIQEATLVMPRQKFAEIVGSIYRNSRKTEIPQHIIENRPLDLYALFTTVAKFGGCAEVSSKDIWSMVGGLMGFVHNGGPPPISSAEVARQLQQIYSEALHVIEGHYLSVIVKQKKESAALMQSRQNQGSAGSVGPSVTPGPRNFGELPNQAIPVNNNQPPTNGAGPPPPMDMGGFTLDQLNRLATANSAQLASYNLSAEQMNIIQRHRASLLAAYQQKSGGMRPPGIAPTLPGSVPNAKGEWVIKGRVITPQDYEKGKQMVGKMYNTHIASIQLVHEQIPEAERANYQKQITNSMQMLKSFDHILTLEFAMRPQRQNDPEVINLYKVAGLLRRAVGKWVTEHIAMLKPQVLGSAFSKVAVETNKIRKTHLPDPLQAEAVPAANSTVASQNPDKAAQPADATAPGTNGVIPPRLRVEDLKPPPGKRQKSNNKDDRSSPAATNARGMSLGTDGNPPTPTVAQNAAMPSPTTKKLPRPKPTRRKPSMASSLKPDMTPKVEKLPVISNGPEDAPPVEATLTLPQFTGLADISPQNNSLGISFRQMGHAALSAHRKEEADGRADPLSFLEASMAKLEDVMRSSGQTFIGLERDLSLPITPALQDTRFDTSMQTRPQLQQRPRQQDSAFDYSSFIDESAFGLGDDDVESANKLKYLQVPAETPELIPNASGVIDPSPTSVTAITPHGGHSSNMEEESVYSPKQGNVEYPLGEDGWLDNLGMDPTYWMS